MSNGFLDKEGLTKYTNKILDLISNISSVQSFNDRTGAVTPQSDDYSVSMVTGAAPKASPKFTENVTIGTRAGTAGNLSLTLGARNEASGVYSAAFGNSSVASSNYSYALGFKATASGNQSYAEGYLTVASGTASHAECAQAKASGDSSHAEGNLTTASGRASHAEGMEMTASNVASHACGKYGKEMTGGGHVDDLIGDVFMIGNGTGTVSSSVQPVYSNALRLDYSGQLYLTKAYNSTGADYAEYFEWLDGNPNNEDRVGHFVTLEGDKIKIAEPGDYILGVISGQPCVIGNADEDWLGRWEHDDFNRFVKEYLMHNEIEVFPPESITEDELSLWLITNDIEERDGHYYQTTTEVVDYPTTSWRHKANPAYDPSQSYVERKDRQEWDAVGMVGVLSVLDDGSCIVNGYAKVTQNGIATSALRTDVDVYRVIGRITPNIIKIVLK